MNIQIIKHIVTAICCLVLSHSAYSVDELYDSEISGLAYFNIPFGSDDGYASPTFGFALGQTPTNIAMGSENDPNLLLSNPTKKALFDIQYDLTELRWSRFAFGGINALVYDDVLHADGGGPTIDPALAVLGIGAAGLLIFVAADSDDESNSQEECTQETTFTSNYSQCCDQNPGFTSSFELICPRTE